MNKKLKLFLPFSLTAFILLADQITKALVVKYLPLYQGRGNPPAVKVFGDFLGWTHVRNKAIAFGLGQNLPDQWKTILFIAIPLLLLAALLVFYFRSKVEMQFRWVLATILGGGLGNMLDRIIRPEGVVDFIDVKFFGIFGMDRWPTFNIADSSVVIAAIFLVVMMFREELVESKKRKEEKLHEQKP